VRGTRAAAEVNAARNHSAATLPHPHPPPRTLGKQDMRADPVTSHVPSVGCYTIAVAASAKASGSLLQGCVSPLDKLLCLGAVALLTPPPAIQPGPEGPEDERMKVQGI
jgi:hypothetical protein